MNKALSTIVVMLAILNIGFAQSTSKLDSLRHELSIANHDTSRMYLMLRISEEHRVGRRDSAILYASKALALARQFNMPKAELKAMGTIALCQIFLGNYSRGLQINLEAIKLAEKNNLIAMKPDLFIYSGLIYKNSNNYFQALNSFREAKIIADSVNNILYSIVASTNMAETYLKMNQLDSALFYGNVAYDRAQGFISYTTYPQYVLGQIYFEKGNDELALNYLHESLRYSSKSNEIFNRNYMIAMVFHETGKPDSSIYYGNKALKISVESNLYSSIIEANILLSDIYEKRNLDKALQHSKSAIAYKDTLDNFRRNATLDAFIDFDVQERQYEIEAATASYQNKVQRLWIFSVTGGLISAVILSFMLYRNNKNKQKANVKLKEQKEEIESTLDKLESTQSQLIQSEKMASLGELTAGIAHEIQNPLNFVNNFSEVNGELLAEAKEELKNGDTQETENILNDVIENEQKINHHGQRASSIVKGMLEHSRTSDGKKEPTDINALADEYLRLAYHGLRAKDKSFNADFKTDFDESLPKIDVVPQDFGRVLLNLINNAFYAVDKKAKEGIDDYKPEVLVTTKAIPLQGGLPAGQAGAGGGLKGVQITVNDNGPGIPEEIKDKIFQPFFTTKPTGSGTGLGLSLSYDIIKAHGGEIKVKSVEGKGSEFIIQTPANNTKK